MCRGHLVSAKLKTIQNCLNFHIYILCERIRIKILHGSFKVAIHYLLLGSIFIACSDKKFMLTGIRQNKHL